MPNMMCIVSTILYLHLPNFYQWRDSKKGKAEGTRKKVPFAIEKQEEEIYIYIFIIPNYILCKLLKICTFTYIHIFV